MFKNKIAIVAIAGMLAMCFGLAACGGNNASSSSAASTSTASSSSATASSSSSSSSSAASTEVVYWSGALADGSTVSYMDDAATAQGALSIIKDDLSDGAVWMGAYTVTGDGMVTITDADTKKNISFTIVDVTPKVSMTMDIDGYGEVVVKAVTAADFEALAEEIANTATAAAVADEGQRLLKKLNREGKKLEKQITKEAKKLAKQLDQLDEKTALYWDGTLADGTFVSYVDDPESKQAVLSIIKSDYSDGAVWYGKYTTDASGKTITLTDEESGKTLSYEVTETTPGTSLKINIEGYGEADLKAVTKSDLTQFAQEAEKLIEEIASALK